MPELNSKHLQSLEAELEWYVNPENMFGFRKAFMTWVADAWSNADFFDTEVRDTGFDQSLFPAATNVKLRDEVKTYCEFINSNTGNSIPTYNSGSGMRCETFDEILYEFFGEKCVLFVDSFIEKYSLTAPSCPELSHCESASSAIWCGEMEGTDDIITKYGCYGYELSPYICEMNGVDSYNLGIFGNFKLSDFC